MADMYDDEAAPSEAPSTPAETEDKGDETDDTLALVPNTFFKKEPKPGMREKVEVVQVYDGECSIKCVYSEEKEEKEEAPAEEASEPDEMMT